MLTANKSSDVSNNAPTHQYRYSSRVWSNSRSSILACTMYDLFSTRMSRAWVERINKEREAQERAYTQQAEQQLQQQRHAAQGQAPAVQQQAAPDTPAESRRHQCQQPSKLVRTAVSRASGSRLARSSAASSSALSQSSQSKAASRPPSAALLAAASSKAASNCSALTHTSCYSSAVPSDSRTAVTTATSVSSTAC